MKLVLLVLAMAAIGSAQTIAQFSSTAGGCRITKQPSPTILATWGCAASDGSMQQSGTIKASSTGLAQPASFTFGPQINILCMFMVNPTGSSVSAGSLPNAPANGISWSCAVDGVAAPNGSAQWP